MLNFVGNLIGQNTASFIADFFAVFYKLFGAPIVNKIKSFFALLLNLVVKYIWCICKWVLGVIDAMQLLFTRLIGLDTGTGTVTSAGEYIEGLKSISTTSGTNYYNYLMKIFRALFAVAILLMIIFTVVAMVMQEYKLASEGYAKADNNKGKFFTIIVKNIIVLFLMPLVFYTLIVGTNSILSAFYRAIGNEPDTTIAGNVLAASTYDANRYRAYANADKRIPITISVYDTTNAFGNTLSDDEIMKQVRDKDTQNKLKAIAGAFANDSFLPFEKSTVNINGTMTNYSNYSLTYNNEVYENMGQYFENFICTREQYYVMADFVDYCQRYNINYYIKSMSESDICWKYVDSLTSAEVTDDGYAYGDVTLTVTYRDAEIINNPTGVASASNTSASNPHTLTFTTKSDLTSPISDALTTVSKLLGIDESTSKYNAMERDNSGDYTNLVNWSTRKVHLKLSDNFKLEDADTWTYSDQIIVYEYYRYFNAFASTNNTLEDYTIEQLKSTGAFLDALEMTYRNYNSNTHTFSDAKTQYCVKINGNYYRVQESETDVDDYGHAYFELAVLDKNTDYFTKAKISITKTGGTYPLKLSPGFDINKSSTWTNSDQVLLYEFCKNLSVTDGTLSEEMIQLETSTGSRYCMLGDFKNDAGVDFNIYEIDGSKYINLNGTYYATSGMSSKGVGNENNSFLIDTAKAGDRWFGYKLSTTERANYGIDNLGALFTDSISSESNVDEDDAMYYKYKDKKFKLSENFSITSTEEWTFRDYAIVYLYVNKFSGDNAITLESLKTVGISGELVRSGNNYYLKVSVKNDPSDTASTPVYVSLAKLEETSELKIMSTLSTEMFNDLGLGLSNVGLVTSYNSLNDSLLKESVSTHTFYLSEEFERYNSKTWTNGDYLLIYLIESGFINVDIGLIQYQGYTALVYETNSGNYYRFGKQDDDNSYFLSEEELSKKGYTADKWFNSNMMSYLLLNVYGTSLSDLIIDEDDFGGGIIDNQDSFIFSYTNDPTSSSSLQYILSKDLITHKDILTDDSLFEYSYANPALVESDLSTWTYIDALIYVKTGELPTLKNPYVSYLVKDGDNNTYFLVEDVLINISSSSSTMHCFTSATTLLTNQIIANKSKAYSTESELTQEYNKYFSNAVKTLSEIGAHAHKGKFYYYSSALQGSGPAEFEENKIYSDFDVVLISLNYTVPDTNGYFVFDYYENADGIYIKFGENYVGMSDNVNARIHYESNFITQKDKMFVKNGTYKSFEESGKMTGMDAVIYSVLGTTESKTYDIYENEADDTKKFIRLSNGSIVKYNDKSTLDVSSIDGEKGSSLYNSIYSNYVSESVTVKTTYSQTLGGIGDDFKTALGIILKCNYISLQNCTLVQTSAGAYYLKFNKTDTVNNEVLTKYISLSGLVSVQLGNSNATLTDIAQTSLLANYTMLWHNIKDYNFNFDSIGLNSSYYKTSGTTAFDQIVYQDIEDYRTNVRNVNMSNWSILGLLSTFADAQGTLLSSHAESYDASGKPETDVDGNVVTKLAVKRYYINGTQYLALKTLDATYYVPLELTMKNGARKSIELLVTQFLIGDNTPEVDYTTQVGTICKNKGYTIDKFYWQTFDNTSGEEVKVLVYLVEDGYRNFHYIYGADYRANGSSKLVTYVYHKDDFDIEYKGNKGEGTYFEIETKPMSDLANWTMLDFVVSFAQETIYKGYISSLYYKYNSKLYVKYNDKYIYLPNSVAKVSTSQKGIIVEYNSKTLMTQLTGIGSTGSTLKTLTRYGDYKNRAGTDIFSQFVQGKLKKADSSKLRFMKFSSNFDVTNYSSWTLSDYILYHVLTSGSYGKKSYSVNCELVYNPSYSITDGNYYNLTYLDRIIYKVNGNTLDSSPVTFTLVYDDNYKYYLKMQEKPIYIPLSSDVSINFNDMEVESVFVGKVFTKKELDEDVDNNLKCNDDTGTGADYYSATVVTSTSNYTFSISGDNFQTLANANNAPAYFFYLLQENPDSGSVSCNKVIKFSNSDDILKSGDCYIYDKFISYYDKLVPSIENYFVKVHDLTVDISTTMGSHDLDLKYNYDQVYPDLEFENYYYFTLNASKLNASKLNDVNATAQSTIKQGNFSGKVHEINLQFSADFDISDTSTWTYLDFIIIYEFSRDVKHNVFSGSTIEELKNESYGLACLYIPNSDGDTNKYLYINGDFYNVAGVIDSDTNETLYYGNDTKDLNGVNVSDIVGAGIVFGFDFKTLYGVDKYSINPKMMENKLVAQYTADSKDTIMYTTGSNTINFKYIDTNVADVNYRIKVSDYAIYTTTTIIKKVSWVEKLMTDMQVYYPDLNWGVLIATDGWIDTLGEFTSAYNNGLYVGGDNSANTTAAGLVLSEFFMSVATPVANSYADYEYSSVFDEDTIRALMLSLVGEDQYQALVFEANVFMDYFNSCFAPIIDDFAEEFGEDIGENSLRLNAYKSYLATLLLSSDIGEYLYTVATRVYAEYTICEYLAIAGGDYSGYYSYVNNLQDEEGNTIDSYTFGSFNELVSYENEYCGNSTPTFTFNFKKAFEKYMDSDGKINGITYDQTIGNTLYYNFIVQKIIDKLDTEYEEIYSQGYEITERGAVIDANGDKVAKYKDEYIFCYMLHVYWSIERECNGESLPAYLTCYRQYIHDELSRWSIICDENIDSADQYFENYGKDKLKLASYKALTFATLTRTYIPGLVTDIKNTDSLIGNLRDLVNAIGQLANGDTVPMAKVERLMKGNKSLENDIKYIQDNTLSLNFIMTFSEDSDFNLVDGIKDVISNYLPADINSPEGCWNRINTFYECVNRVVDELVAIRNILPGEKTENGLDREITSLNGDKNLTDDELDSLISKFQDIQYNLGQYISTQTRIDQMQKRSITFTLAQFGANYVSSGYEFSVKNKNYTFKATTDPSRLAEYVYGGTFLESIGVGAQYTDPEFDGIIKSSKVYDPSDNTLKTKLDSWLELRTFLSEIADKTAELYYLTNLKDLDINTKNGVYLTDNISVSGKGSIESKLYNYICEQLNNNELVTRVTSGKSKEHDKFVAISNYLFLNTIDESEFEQMTLEDYKRIVIKQLIENKENSEESAEERASRYLTLFNLLSVQVEFIYDSKAIGRIIPKVNITRTGNTISYQNKVTVSTYSSTDENTSNVVTYATGLSGTFSASYNTLEMVKTLSGLENRPTFEVLTREYAGTRTGDYYDEAYGDTFIACLYNESDGLYYPVLASGSKVCSGTKYNNFFTEKNLQKHKFVSEYYGNEAYLVICKGVITADGYPTAIRKYNSPLEVEQKNLLSTSTITYNSISFYRTNVGANLGDGEDLVDASRAISRVTTKNYTKYVYGTSYSKGIGSSTTYTGKTNLRTIVSSDYSAYYLQNGVEYLISQTDDFGGISVLDEFSYYYVFSGQTWVLLVLAFITIIPVMINAVGGAISRMFDLIILFIASPVVISTNSLFVNGKNKGYENWKKNIASALMGVFGYIIGFSCFNIMITATLNIKSFISIATYNKIKAIGGIGNFVSYPTVNSLARSLWVITTVSILERIPKLMMPIITANYGDLSSPHTGLGAESRSFTEKVKEVGGSVEKSMSQIRSIVSGKAMLGLIEEVKQEAKNMIPGYSLASSAKKTFVDPIKNKVKDNKMKAEESAIEEALLSQGVSPAIAKKAAKEAMDVKRKADEDKKKQKEKMKKYQDEFKKNFM